MYNGHDEGLLLLLRKGDERMTHCLICDSRSKENTKEETEEHLHGLDSDKIETLVKKIERRRKLIEGKDRSRMILLVNVKKNDKLQECVLFWLRRCKDF